MPLAALRTLQGATGSGLVTFELEHFSADIQGQLLTPGRTTSVQPATWTPGCTPDDLGSTEKIP